MPLPETIAVHYTEEEAEYLSVRPVVRQNFRLDELLDMILTVTGKQVARIQQILRAGTLVFHGYRYWWQGFEAESADLVAALARFPDADPQRPFRVEECNAVLLEGGGSPPHPPIEVDAKAAAQKRLFSSRSFWDCLLEPGRARPPAYRGYSYQRRADLYELPLAPEQVAALVRSLTRLAPRSLRVGLRALPAAARIVYVCPRQPPLARL